jgi:hypothetical protein
MKHLKVTLFWLTVVVFGGAINCQEPIFTCDFDTDDCGGTPNPPFASNTNGVYFNLFSSFAQANSRSLSDVTSITQPTANGLVCDIPFNFSNPLPTQHYHCLARAQFDCITTDGSLARCADGRFLHSRAAIVGTPYNYVFTFPKINIETSGLYEISFYVFYSCGASVANCQNANEVIILTVNEQETVYDYAELSNNLPWVKKQLRFNLETQDLEIKVTFARRAQVIATTYLAFDQLEVTEWLEGSFETVTSTATPTTTEPITTTSTTVAETTVTVTETTTTVTETETTITVTETTTTTDTTSLEPTATTPTILFSSSPILLSQLELFTV